MALGEKIRRIIPEGLVVKGMVREYVRSMGGSADGIEANPLSGTVARGMSKVDALRRTGAKLPDYSILTGQFLDDLRAERDQRHVIDIPKYNVNAVRELYNNTFTSYTPDLRAAIAGAAGGLLDEAFGGIRDERVGEILGRIRSDEQQAAGVNRETRFSGLSIRQLLDSLLSNPPTSPTGPLPHAA